MFSILYDAGRSLTAEEWNERARDVGLGTRKASLYDYRMALKARGLVVETTSGWLVKQPAGEE